MTKNNLNQSITKSVKQSPFPFVNWMSIIHKEPFDEICKLTYFIPEQMQDLELLCLSLIKDINSVKHSSHYYTEISKIHVNYLELLIKITKINREDSP